MARTSNVPSQSPGASLTDVVALNGGLGGPEAETDVLHPSPAALSSSLGLAALLLVVLENVRLLLESALALDSQFGGHDCCVLGAIGREVGVSEKSSLSRAARRAFVLRSTHSKFEECRSAD